MDLIFTVTTWTFLVFIGNNECIAHVYPDEPVNKLWSLLKLNSNEHSMASSTTPHVPLKSGSIGDVSKGDDLTLIISKNKGSADVRIDSHKSRGSQDPSEKRSAEEKPVVKSRKEVSSVSKNGSLVSNVNISIDSNSIVGGLSRSSSERPSADKEEAKSKKPSQQSLGSLKELSKSLKTTKSPKGSKNSIVESRLSGERKDSRHSKLNSEGSKTSIEKKEPVVDGTPKKGQRYQSVFPPEITPKNRAKSLSKHLSGSSLHKTSFKESLRKLEVISEVEASPSPISGVPSALISNLTMKRSGQIDEEGIQPKLKDSRHSKLNSEGSKTSIAKKEPVVDGTPKKGQSYQSVFPPEKAPQNRAKSLSKQLSGSSLHKTSFKESLRKLEVISEVEASPSPMSGMPSELISNATIKRSGQIYEEGIQPAMKSPVKKLSNNSAEGLSTFVLPTGLPQHEVGAEPVVAKLPSLQDAVKQPSIRAADEQPSPQGLAKQPSLRDSAKRPSLQSAAKQPSLQDAAKQDASEDIVEYPQGGTDRAGDNAIRIPDDGPQEAAAAAASAVANDDALHAEKDAPSAGGSAGSKLLGLEPLPHPPADGSNPTVAPARTSGEIPTPGKSPGGPTASSPPVQETTQDVGEDIHSEMKTFVTSAILGIGTGTRLDDIAAKNNDLPKPEAAVTEPKRRKSSDSPKTLVDRENWHPVEEPPAIRTSDLDVAHDESVSVQPIANNHKTSYSTSDSEQIFGRYQHPQAEKDDELKTTDAPKENNSETKEKIENPENHNGKKKKGKSNKKESIQEAESAELDGAVAESMKSESAASVQSEAENDEAATANELDNESITAV